jgi:hypothetical protein
MECKGHADGRGHPIRPVTLKLRDVNSMVVLQEREMHSLGELLLQSSHERQGKLGGVERLPHAFAQAEQLEIRRVQALGRLTSVSERDQRLQESVGGRSRQPSFGRDRGQRAVGSFFDQRLEHRERAFDGAGSPQNGELG